MATQQTFSEIIRVRVDKGLKKRLSSIARQKHAKQSEIMRRALLDYVETAEAKEVA